MAKIQKNVEETAARSVIDAMMHWLEKAHKKLKQQKVCTKFAVVNIMYHFL